MFKERLTYIVVIIVLAVFGWYQYDKEPEQVERVVEVYRDSIVFKTDTIKPDPTIKTVIKEIPKYVYLKDTIKYYRDSLITEQFDIWINDQIKGTLENRYFEYVNKSPVVINNDKETIVYKFRDVIKDAPNVGNFIGADCYYNYKTKDINFGFRYIRYKNEKAGTFSYSLDGNISGGLLIRF